MGADTRGAPESQAERGSGVVKGAISATGLHLFFQITAPDDRATGWTPPTVQQCAELIKRYSDMADDAYRITGVGTKPKAYGSAGLSIEAFQLLLTDVVFNHAADPERLYSVYQDMTRPLSHYFISSSHNTYLTGNQLNSASSGDAVIHALKRGIRVIELDVWDASSGTEPIVNHGRTLCTPTSFHSCVKAIADFGFVVSELPIILTIENHCTAPFQERMSKILFELLGSRLFRFAMPGQDLYAGPEEWVSPSQMRGKVVLRDKPKRIHVARKTEHAKRKSLFGAIASRKSHSDLAVVVKPPELRKEDGSGRSHGTTGTDDLDEEDDFIDETNEEEGVGAPLAKVEQEARKLSLAIGGSVRLALDELGADASKVPWLQSTQQMMTDSVPNLLELVYIKNVKLRMVTDTSVRDPYKQLSFVQPPWRSSSSIVESKMLKLAKPGPSCAALATYTKKNLVRCYPNAARIESSSYDPSPAWVAGIQIAAINVQTASLPLWVNMAQFADNGGCGWVLKPKEMLDAAPCGEPGDEFPGEGPPRYWSVALDPFAPTDKLTIKIISAHYLPKPAGANVDRSEIIDPFVEMKMFGVDMDVDDGKRTKVITDNGFNPLWNESFDFAVRVPELANLIFIVKDKDLFSEAVIAQAGVPCRLLRPGYRVLPLRRPDGAPILHAFLFFYVTCVF